MANISGEMGYLDKHGCRNLTDKQDKVLQLVEKGMDLKESIIKAGYAPQSVSVVKQKYSKYFDNRKSMVKKSASYREQVLDRALSGDPDYIVPAERISTRVQERIDPIKRQDNDNAGAVIQFTQFNIQLIKNE